MDSDITDRLFKTLTRPETGYMIVVFIAGCTGAP